MLFTLSKKSSDSYVLSANYGKSNRDVYARCTSAGTIGIGAVLVCLAIGGLHSRFACDRIEPTQVNCTISDNIWNFPLQKTDLKKATLARIVEEGDEEKTTYKVYVDAAGDSTYLSTCSYSKCLKKVEAISLFIFDRDATEFSLGDIDLLRAILYIFYSLIVGIIVGIVALIFFFDKLPGTATITLDRTLQQANFHNEWQGTRENKEKLLLGFDLPFSQISLQILTGSEYSDKYFLSVGVPKAIAERYGEKFQEIIIDGEEEELQEMQSLLGLGVSTILVKNFDSYSYTFDLGQQRLFVEEKKLSKQLVKQDFSLKDIQLFYDESKDSDDDIISHINVMLPGGRTQVILSHRNQETKAQQQYRTLRSLLGLPPDLLEEEATGSTGDKTMETGPLQGGERTASDREAALGEALPQENSDLAIDLNAIDRDVPTQEVFVGKFGTYSTTGALALPLIARGDLLDRGDPSQESAQNKGFDANNIKPDPTPDLQALGFEFVGDLSVSTFPKIRAYFFVSLPARTYASIWVSKSLTCLEFTTEFVDGSSLSTTDLLTWSIRSAKVYRHSHPGIWGRALYDLHEQHLRKHQEKAGFPKQATVNLAEIAANMDAEEACKKKDWSYKLLLAIGKPLGRVINQFF